MAPPSDIFTVAYFVKKMAFLLKENAENCITIDLQMPTLYFVESSHHWRSGGRGTNKATNETGTFCQTYSAGTGLQHEVATWHADEEVGVGRPFSAPANK